jgi:hypothetical protein
MGGRTGGWDARDHDAFLKVLTVLQHKSQAAADEIEAAFLATPPGDASSTHALSPRAGTTAQGGGLSPSRRAGGDATDASLVPPRRELSQGILAKFIAMVPGKTPDEIEDHLRW